MVVLFPMLIELCTPWFCCLRFQAQRGARR
jgi:hypothetical protein